MQTDLRQVAARQDAIIHHPLLRAFFGPRGFYNAGYHHRRVRKQEQACVQLMERLAARMSVRTGHILDVGCGLGATTAELRRLFPAAFVTGANLSHQQTRESQLHTDGATFVEMDGAHLAVRNASIDAVVAVESVLFFETRRDFLRESARVLVPGGELVVTDILFSSASWARDWHVPEQNHITGITEYRALLEAAGFGAICIEDGTEHCWKPMWRCFLEWLEDACRLGDIHAEDATRWRLLAGRFRDEAVAHYLLIWATAE